MNGLPVAWEPNPPLPGNALSSQTLFLSCPLPEVILTGNRGGGKTEVLLVDFLQHVGAGFGPFWRGVIFRRTYKELEDLIAKGQRIIPRIFPEAKYNLQSHTWTFPQGEALLFRYMRTPADYWSYHGHEYPFVGWEELTTWPTRECYDLAKSLCRSSHPGIPKKYRSTTNPWGPGHAWVKNYIVDPAPPGTPIPDDEGRLRVRIRSFLEENAKFLAASPEYPKTLDAIEDTELRNAWRWESWDISAGAYFADVWRRQKQVLPPEWKPGKHWRRSLSLDWGSTSPSAVGLWARSPGETVHIPGRGEVHFPRGSWVLEDEIYTVAQDARGQVIPNTGLRLLASGLGKMIARKIRGATYAENVADPSIWTEDGRSSIHSEIKAGAASERVNLDFQRGNNARVDGWEIMRRHLSESAKDRPEGAGLWISARCRHWLRTVPILARSQADPDDLDTELEDHHADQTRYRLATLTGGVQAREIS